MKEHSKTRHLNDDSQDKVRLDKWLWAARFFKTRALAKDAVEGGKVQYNGQRTKPGKLVELHAKLLIRQGWDEKEVLITAISDQRKGAPEASRLYAETEDSLAAREKKAWERKHLLAAQLPPARRPTKKQRRQIHSFKEQAVE
ncbi:MAG: ribosome-associated heat shock protein Hsp15 [Hahellaceae bacterium]|nr:ribosome-associated heat shock protein Hsp15 [Hahellaceae bacterium]MCP5169305.1 ribosome-associated heat shock protein Hsp15 [Hahellaceae bacterium]